MIEKLVVCEEMWILYELLYCLKEILKVIIKIIGNDWKIVLCWEFIKRFEEFLCGMVEDVLNWVMDEEVCGEFCLIIEGNVNLLFVEE